MPANPGRNPFEGNDNPPLVDIKYRNGIVVRAIDPNKRRWVRWPEGPHDFDIVSYQIATGKDYEVVWPADGDAGTAKELINNPRKSAGFAARR